MDRLGVPWVKEEIERRIGYSFEEARPYKFEHSGDRYGWIKGEDGLWHFTLFIQNGRIKDFEGYPLKTGLREIAKVHTGEFRLTGNQNLVIAKVSSQKKRKINDLIEQYNITDGKETRKANKWI